MTRRTWSLYSTVVKKAVDLSGSALLLVFTSPLHALCALLVLLDDGPPVYFSQERVGRDGALCRIHKLRTMKAGTETAFGNYPAAAAVTRSGRFLRRTSLDELPQLINILAGDMSFVGPRPALADQGDRYSCPQRRRLLVRPGITGLAQIRYRNDAPWSQRIRADLEYVDHISPLLDMKIALRTVPVVFRGGGQIVGQTAAVVDDLGAPFEEPSDA